MRGQINDECKKKKKMSDGIIQRADGSWSFVVELPRDPDTGKRRQKWETVRGTRKDAERRRREVLSQIDHGLFAHAPAKMTLGEFLYYYLDIVKGKRENTFKGYAVSFKAFRKCFGDSLMLSNLKTDMVQRAVNELSSKLEKSTVGVYFTNFKTAIKYALKAGYIIFDPCEVVIIIKPVTKEKAVWDDDQANHFIRFCKTTKLMYATLFVALLKTGVRIGEMLALRWTDVDIEAGLIHITRTVSGKGYNPPKSANGIRKVPLDQGTVRMLSKHRIQQGKEKLLHGEGYNQENLVFCTEEGRRIRYVPALRSFMQLVKEAGLPYIMPHGLRHTHATFLLGHGHSVNLVAERLGDDPKTIMKTYAHVLPGMQAEAVRTIERLYD